MSEAFIMVTVTERTKAMSLGVGAFAVYTVLKELAMKTPDLTTLYHPKLISAHIGTTASNISKWLRKLADAGLIVIEAAVDHLGERIFVPALAEQFKRYRSGRPILREQTTSRRRVDEEHRRDLSTISKAPRPQERRVKSEECSVFSNEKTAQAPIEKVNPSPSSRIETSAKPETSLSVKPLLREPEKPLATETDSGLVRCEPAKSETFRMPRNKFDRDVPMTMEERIKASRDMRGLGPQKSIEELRANALRHRKEIGLDLPLPDDGPVLAQESPPPNLVKILFDNGVALLTDKTFGGKTEQEARKVIGMLRGLAGDDERVLRAIEAAKREKPIDPVPWLREALKVDVKSRF